MVAHLGGPARLAAGRGSARGVHITTNFTVVYSAFTFFALVYFGSCISFGSYRVLSRSSAHSQCLEMLSIYHTLCAETEKLDAAVCSSRASSVPFHMSYHVWY